MQWPRVVRAAAAVLVVSAVARLAGSAIDLVTNPALGIAAFPLDISPRAVAVLSSVFRLQFVVDLALTVLLAVATLRFRHGRNWARVVLQVMAMLDMLVYLVGLDGSACGCPGERCRW